MTIYQRKSKNLGFSIARGFFEISDGTMLPQLVSFSAAHHVRPFSQWQIACCFPFHLDLDPAFRSIAQHSGRGSVIYTVALGYSAAKL